MRQIPGVGVILESMPDLSSGESADSKACMRMWRVASLRAKTVHTIAIAAKGLHTQAHALAELTADETAHAVRLPLCRGHQSSERCAGGLAQQAKNLLRLGTLPSRSTPLRLLGRDGRSYRFRGCLAPLWASFRRDGLDRPQSLRTPLVRSVNLRIRFELGSWFHTSTSRAVGQCFAAKANSSALRKTTLPAGASCSEEKTRT
jgi:hypothetical protein